MESNYSSRIGNQLNGRAIGSMIFAGFGALWLTLGGCATSVASLVRNARLRPKSTFPIPARSWNWVRGRAR